MRTKHHTFCNYFALPVEGCKQCTYLDEHYPEDNNPWVTLASNVVTTPRDNVSEEEKESDKHD